MPNTEQYIRSEPLDYSRLHENGVTKDQVLAIANARLTIQALRGTEGTMQDQEHQKAIEELNQAFQNDPVQSVPPEIQVPSSDKKVSSMPPKVSTRSAPQKTEGGGDRGRFIEVGVPGIGYEGKDSSSTQLDTVRKRFYEEAIMDLEKQVSRINQQYQEKTGLIGKTQDWIVSASGGQSAKEIYEQAIGRIQSQARILGNNIQADAPKLGTGEVNSLIGKINALTPGMKLAPMSIGQAAINSGRTALHATNGIVEGVYGTLEGIVTGSADLVKFCYSYGVNEKYRGTINTQVGKVYNYVMDTHYETVMNDGGKTWGIVKGVIAKELQRINGLPEDQRAFAIGNIGGNIIGVLITMKAGIEVAKGVARLGRSTQQADRILTRLAETGKGGSARVERVTRLQRQAQYTKYGAQGIDVILNGIGESIIGVALTKTLIEIKGIIAASSISLAEKFAALQTGINQVQAELRKPGVSSQQKQAFHDVEEALVGTKQTMEEGVQSPSSRPQKRRSWETMRGAQTQAHPDIEDVPVKRETSRNTPPVEASKPASSSPKSGSTEEAHHTQVKSPEQQAREAKVELTHRINATLTEIAKYEATLSDTILAASPDTRTFGLILVKRKEIEEFRRFISSGKDPEYGIRKFQEFTKNPEAYLEKSHTYFRHDLEKTMRELIELTTIIHPEYLPIFRAVKEREIATFRQLEEQYRRNNLGMTEKALEKLGDIIHGLIEIRTMTPINAIKKEFDSLINLFSGNIKTQYTNIMNGFDRIQSNIEQSVEMTLEKKRDILSKLKRTRKEMEPSSTGSTRAAANDSGMPSSKPQEQNIRRDNVRRDIDSRNTNLREWHSVKREREILAVGDLHGNMSAFEGNLQKSGMIDPQGNWIGGNKEVIFHGDIFADRQTNSFAIMDRIDSLRKQAERNGGKVTVLAGNHDDFAFALLTGKKVPYDGKMVDVSNMTGGGQADGIAEFVTKFGGRDTSSLENNKILENMRKSSEGRKILEQMSSMRLLAHVDDTLFLHVVPNNQIAQMIIRYGGIDRINSLYTAGLIYHLFGQGQAVKEFDELRKIFLDTQHRGHTDITPENTRRLKEMGINLMVHGHDSDNAGKTIQQHGITITGNDFGYEKKPGKNSNTPSTVHIGTDGQVSYGNGTQLQGRRTPESRKAA